MHSFITKFQKEIICEFLPPRRITKKQKVIILCDGMPSVPSKKMVMDLFSQKSYWIFHPRYRGTWESGGRFLKNSPEKDILDVINSLSKGFKDIWSGKRFKVTPDQLFIIGTSFGGPAAILLSGNPRVTKSIAIAPVVDWQSPDMLRTDAKELRFTRQAFGPVYRFSQKDWQKLSRGKFYNPVAEINRVKGDKLLIIHAKDDEIVAFGPSKRFAAKTGARFIALPKGGHIGHSIMLKPSVYRQIRQFLP